MRDIWIVFGKELKEVTRDKRTLIFMVVLPVLLIPTLFEVTTRVVSASSEKEAGKVLRVAVDGDNGVGARLRARLGQGRGFVVVAPSGDLAARVRSGDLDLGVQLGATAGGRERVVVLHDDASVTSKAKARLGEVLTALGAELRRERLDEAGIVGAERQEAVVSPLEVMEVGVASPREVIGERVGATLPLLLIMFCFFGAMYPAIDLAAGEKERGTLMTLLLCPVARWRLVMGKLLVVFVTGVVSAVLSIVGIGTWLALQSGELEGALGEVLAAIGWVDLALIGLVLVPTTLIFASLLLSISIWAKSFKEAQSYIAPLNMLVVLPAFVATLPGVELDAMTAWVPVTNASLAIGELVKGTLDGAMLWPVLGSGFGVGVVLLWVSTRWFGREAVVFRR